MFLFLFFESFYFDDVYERDSVRAVTIQNNNNMYVIRRVFITLFTTWRTATRFL